MKGEKDALWEKLPNALRGGKTDMNANEILGKDITMKVGTGSEPREKGESEKAPAYTKPTTEVDVAGGDLEKSPKGEAEGAYASSMGSGKEKISKMAQKVGSPRKG